MNSLQDKVFDHNYNNFLYVNGIGAVDLSFLAQRLGCIVILWASGISIIQWVSNSVSAYCENFMNQSIQISIKTIFQTRFHISTV